MISRRKSGVPLLGMSPDKTSPFFSAMHASEGEYQEHAIFRREQLNAWMRVNAKRMRGQRVTERDVKAIEPAAMLILRIDQNEFEAKLLINVIRREQE